MQQPKALLIRLPQNMKRDLEEIKEEEARPMAAIVREALNEYLTERKRKNALNWFISSYCSKCGKNCKVGSFEMLKCMMKRVAEKGGKENE